MQQDPWHFPRPEFTEQVLSTLTQGPAQALTLFAPRRTGKTEFLLKDLAPLAEEREHPVIYASFWQTPFSPLGVLLYELETWLAGAGFHERMRSAATALAPKLRLSAAPLGVGVEAEVDLSALRGRPPDSLLLHLDGLLERVSRRGRPAILLLDEVQELARRPENEALVAALRTSLDRRSDRLRVVFTGSSREGLAAMFSARTAPFFHFASQIGLPVLGDGFVHHLMGAFRTASGRTLPPAEMLAAFGQMRRSPFVFRTLLDVLLHDPALTVEAAMDEVRSRIAASLDYSRVWLSAQSAAPVNGQRPGDGPGSALHQGIPGSGRGTAPGIPTVRRLAFRGRCDGWCGSTWPTLPRAGGSSPIRSSPRGCGRRAAKPHWRAPNPSRHPGPGTAARAARPPAVSLLSHGMAKDRQDR